MSLDRHDPAEVTRHADHPATSRNLDRKARKKQQLLQPYVRNSSVLHVGCLGPGIDDGPWLHGWLDAEASECVGVDIRQQGVARARDRGYDVRCQDAQRLALDQRFDAVVATNVIEHVRNPGMVLERACEHLRPDGCVLITTPRTMIPWNLAREFWGGIDPHDEHVMWFCEATLRRLVERSGYRVDRYESWGSPREPTTTPDRVWRALEKAIAVVWSEATDYQHFVVASPAGDRA